MGLLTDVLLSAGPYIQGVNRNTAARSEGRRLRRQDEIAEDRVQRDVLDDELRRRLIQSQIDENARNASRPMPIDPLSPAGIDAQRRVNESRPRNIDPNSPEGIAAAAAKAAANRRLRRAGVRPGTLTPAQLRRQTQLLDPNHGEIPTASPRGTVPSPDARIRAARRRMVQEGAMTDDQMQTSPASTTRPAPAQTATASESPADLWERLVDEGMSEEQATAEVRRRTSAP